MLTAVKYIFSEVQLQCHGHKRPHVTSRIPLWLMYYILKTGPLQVVFYAMRLACSMLLLEIMSHTLYFSSITRYSLWQQYGAQLQLTAVDMGMISFWVLVFMWLKVSIIFTQQHSSSVCNLQQVLGCLACADCHFSRSMLIDPSKATMQLLRSSL